MASFMGLVHGEGARARVRREGFNVNDVGITLGEGVCDFEHG